MSDADAAPSWLAIGALVRVVPSSSTRAAPYTARVVAVVWPWLVYLDDGKPGAVHPARVSPATT